MYLSKCIINSRKPIDPYQLHRELWKLFPDRPNDRRDFLFRVENLGKREPQRILLQSKEMPVSNHKSIVALIESRSVDYENLRERMVPGRLLRFLVRANPTKRIKDESKTGNQGRVRVPLIDEDAMKLWLERQLEEGALLKEVMINGQNVLYFKKAKHAGKVMTVTYSGLLEIKDGDLFTMKLQNGIGPAKAFGCGLMLVRRV